MTITKVTTIIVSNCSRILGPPCPPYSLYFNISAWKRKKGLNFVEKSGSIAPIHTAEMSLQQSFRGRPSRNLGVISHEISAQPWNLCGERLQCGAKRGSSVFAFLGPCWLLLACSRFFPRRDALARPKARFNANQQQKIARAHPSGAFKEGKVWFAKNVKNSNWMTKSCGQGTADEPGMEEVQNIRRKIPEKDF